MKTVELHLASSWDCDNCGTENFARSVTKHLDPDVPEDYELIVAFGLEDQEDPVAMTEPTVVVCSACKETYATKESE